MKREKPLTTESTENTEKGHRVGVPKISQALFPHLHAVLCFYSVLSVNSVVSKGGV